MPGMTLDFTLRNMEKQRRSRRLRYRQAGRLTRQRPSTIARRSTTRSSSAAPTCAGTCSAARSVMSSAPTTTARPPPTATARFFAGLQPTTSARAEKFAYLAHLSLRHARRSWPPSMRLRPGRDGGRALHAGKSRPTFADGSERERGRMAYTGEWRGELRRPPVPDRRHPPRRQRQVPGLHDLADGRPRWCSRSSACGRTPASARRVKLPDHVRAVRHRARSSCPIPT